MLLLTLSLRRWQPETLEELHDLSHEMPFSFYDAWGRHKYVHNIKVRGLPQWVESTPLDDYDIKLKTMQASV
ncbi:MAG: hypothetical protein WEB53_11490 [Akkermansiaceae bacterium]